jgi:hypothetical protein
MHLSSILHHIEHPDASAGLLVQLEHLMIARDHAPVGAVSVPLNIPPAILQVPTSQDSHSIALATPEECDRMVPTDRDGDWRSDVRRRGYL